MSITNEAKEEVRRLLRAGEKIKAIRFVCETLSVSLPQGKALVAALEAEMKAGAPVSEVGDEVKAEVSNLLSQNAKLEAVKFVKEWFDIGLKEALDVVETIERNSIAGHRPEVAAKQRNPIGLFVKIFGGIGTLLIFIALIITYFNQKSISSSDLIKGTVVDLAGSRSGYAPVVKYNYHGVERFYRSSVYSTPPAYDIGEEVELFVNREDVNDILLNSFIDRWLAVTIVGCIGFFFLGFAFLFGFLANRF